MVWPPVITVRIMHSHITHTVLAGGYPYYDTYAREITRYSAVAFVAMHQGEKPAGNSNAFDAREVMHKSWAAGLATRASRRGYYLPSKNWSLN